MQNQTTSHQKHENGCIDGYLPVSPIDRRQSAIPCPLCEAENVQEHANAHTPGPWAAEPWEDNRPGIFVGAVGEGYVANIAPENSETGTCTAEDWANARLIAASPRLVKALQAMLSCCTDDNCHDAIEAEAAIRQAIPVRHGGGEGE